VPHERPIRNAASAGEAPQTPCHPERSMRIRLTNPHAQSGSLRAHPRHDRVRELSPYRIDHVERTLLSAAFDVGLDFDREGHEFHSCRINAQ